VLGIGARRDEPEFSNATDHHSCRRCLALGMPESEVLDTVGKAYNLRNTRDAALGSRAVDHDKAPPKRRDEMSLVRRRRVEMVNKPKPRGGNTNFSTVVTNSAASAPFPLYLPAGRAGCRRLRLHLPQRSRQRY